ncbi:MAG TPA: helix-turn-helix domain-containing protein [Planctomycetota bacterium]|nr:helix-turn-helix domain-containing protein [Planctomycetota bacterium]
MKLVRKINLTRQDLNAMRAHTGARPSPAFIAAKVRSIRERMEMSQAEFAAMLRVSKPTLQNWEQARCTPEGPALSLLMLVDRVPATVRKVLARSA